jgi:hypothetical protein
LQKKLGKCRIGENKLEKETLWIDGRRLGKNWRESRSEWHSGCRNDGRCYNQRADSLFF